MSHSKLGTLILSPRNTFLQFWTAVELREWIRELRWRARSPEIYQHDAPTLAQTTAELKRRRLTMTPGRRAKR